MRRNARAVDAGDHVCNADADWPMTANPFFRAVWFLSLLLVVGGTEAGSESTAHSEGTSTEASGHSGTSEKILGINTESTGLVTVVVALSVALAVLVLVRARREMFLVVAGFATLFAVFDIVEVVHQINNSRAGIATIAAALLLIHVTAALLSAQRRNPVVLGQRMAA